MSLGEATAQHAPDDPADGLDVSGAVDGAEPPAPTRRQVRRRGRRLVAVAVVVVLLAAGAGVWWWTDRSDGASATVTATTKQVLAVSSGTLDTTVTAEGTVAAADTDNLSFASAGTVTAVNVAAGDKVTKGEVLATIDSAALDAAVAKAQATLAAAQAKLSDDQTAAASDEQLAADQSSVTVAEDALTAAQTADAGASLTSTIDGTVTAVNLTVGQQLSASGAGGTSLTGSATGSGRSAGAIGSGSGSGQSNNQNAATSSSAQIQVVSTGSFVVGLAVGSTDIASVASGQPVTMSVTTSSTATNGGNFAAGAFAGGARQRGAAAGAGGGQNTGNGASGATGQGGAAGQTGAAAQAATGATATGSVTDVSKVATATSGVASYTVKVAFTADPSTIFIGSNVTAAITTAQRSGVTLVPIAAVTTTGGRSTVEVASDGTATGPTATRPVTLGQTSGAMVEVTKGLAVGDKVVVEVPAAFAGRTGGQGRTGTGTGTGGGRAPAGSPGG